MATRRLEIRLADLTPTRLLAWELRMLCEDLQRTDPETAARLHRILVRWLGQLEDSEPSS